MRLVEGRETVFFSGDVWGRGFLWIRAYPATKHLLAKDLRGGHADIILCFSFSFAVGGHFRRTNDGGDREAEGAFIPLPLSPPPICVNTVRDSPIPLQYFADSANFFPPFLADASLEGKQKVSFLILHGCEFSFQDRGPRDVTRDEIGGKEEEEKEEEEEGETGSLVPSLL